MSPPLEPPTRAERSAPHRRSAAPFSPTATLLAALLLGAPLVAPLGCGKSEAQREGEAVAAAIGRMRDARRQERGPMIEALAALEPRGAIAKEARATCLESYRGLQAGHEELDAIQAALAAAKTAGTDADPALLDKLLAAEAKIATAEVRRAACASAVAALRRSLR